MLTKKQRTKKNRREGFKWTPIGRRGGATSSAPYSIRSVLETLVSTGKIAGYGAFKGST